MACFKEVKNLTKVCCLHNTYTYTKSWIDSVEWWGEGDVEENGRESCSNHTVTGARLDQGPVCHKHMGNGWGREVQLKQTQQKISLPSTEQCVVQGKNWKIL